MSDSRGVAFVTGASRGIGKAVAVHLARAGYDVALAARTIHEGEEREHSSTVKRSDTSPLPGSLDTTAALVEAEGRQAMSVYLRHHRPHHAGLVGHPVLERWGRIDVLVNNARYIGPGHMDRLLDTPIELLDKHLEANAMAPLILTKLVLPQMIERGSGIIMTVTSGAGRRRPARAPRARAAGASATACRRARCNRLIGIVKLEHEQDGILAFNLHPGFITTERIIQDMAAFGFDAEAGAPPDVIGAAAAYLCTAPEARELNGQWIEGQELTADLGLLPGWDSPGSVSVPPGDGLDA